ILLRSLREGNGLRRLPRARPGGVRSVGLTPAAALNTSQHDPTLRHRDRPLPGAVRALFALSVGDAGGRAASRCLVALAHRHAHRAGARAGARQLRGAGAVFRRGAELELRPGAYRGRQARPGNLEVRLDAPWLHEGPLARLIAVLDRDG